MHINGQEVAHEPISCPTASVETRNWPATCWREQIDGVSWVVGADAQWESMDRSPVTIPPGHVYVLGDHRDHSNDSTNPLIGAVRPENILGIVSEGG